MSSLCTPFKLRCTVSMDSIRRELAQGRVTSWRPCWWKLSYPDVLPLPTADDKISFRAGVSLSFSHLHMMLRFDKLYMSARNTMFLVSGYRVEPKLIVIRTLEA
ncbi:hypothetical protein C8Q70DRAFT_966292 [Cubamyces menziesii]|nr:hypothetical protein C8Q70DRAFT_966292 [Cubamyces menziesii]